MATYNSVPLGQAGTGAAYILPQSKALQGLIDNIDYNRKMGLLNIKAKGDYNSATNKAFLDNQLKVKQGILFQDDLNNATQQWVDKGAKYRAQGFNPFSPNSSNPEEIKASNDFLKEKSAIEGMADIRDVYQKNYLKQQSEYEKGNADEESWNSLNDFYKNTKLADLYEAGVTPPSLMPKFDSAGFMKTIAAPTISTNKIENGVETNTTTPNMGAIRLNVEEALARDKQAQRTFNKAWGVDPSAAPAKKIMGTLDAKEIGDTLDQYYRTDPEGIKEALKIFPPGTTPSSQSKEYQSFKQEQVQKQLSQEQKYDDGLNGLAEERAGTRDQKDLTKFNFGVENQDIKRANLQLSRDRLALARQTHEDARKDKAEKDTPITIRDRTIKGLQLGNTEDMMNLRQIVKQKGGYVGTDSNGALVVKFKEKIDGQTKPTTVKIDLSQNNQGGYAALNELLNRVAGKKIPLETLQAKPEYDGGIVDIGESSLSKPQVETLRSTFGQDYKSLGDNLIRKGMYKNRTEAYKAAAQILDPKGRIHKVK